MKLLKIKKIDKQLIIAGMLNCFLFGIMGYELTMVVGTVSISIGLYDILKHK